MDRSRICGGSGWTFNSGCSETLQEPETAMIYLKQSTASQEVPLGYFLDDTDGNTEETGLTIANTDIKIWKYGTTTLANKNSGGATHISTGIYQCTLDATDTDTVGSLVIFIHVAGGLPVRLECQVLEEDIFDAMFAASADAFDSSALIKTYSSLATASALATVDGIVDNILIDTAEIGTAGVGLSDLGGMSTGMKAEVNTEADAAIVTYGLDHLVFVAVAGADVADNSIVADLVSKSATSDYDDFVNTTDSLQAIRDKQTDIETDTAEIGSAVGADISADIAAVKVDTAATLVDTGTTIPALLPSALISGRMDCDVEAINNNTTSADNLALSTDEMEAGTVDNTAFTATTTILESDDITETTPDHYNDRLLVFTSGALRKQVTKISDYEINAGRGKFTYVAVTDAPADDSTFLIV